MKPGPAAIITVRDLTKSYGDIRAVDGLSFDVYPGEVLGLLGPNGAGKTTTVNMLTTLLPIDSGTASIAGFDVSNHPSKVRRVIGLAGQVAAVDDKLTARENLEMFGRLYKLPKDVRRRRMDDLIETFDLGEIADRPAATYSGGQRRRLDVVASLIASPAALFLDEPTTGLDPRTRSELWTEIRRLADQGTAVVLTTQYLDEADRLSDRIVIIDRGDVVAAGTSADLKDDLERDVLEVHFDKEVDVPAAAVAAGGRGLQSAGSQSLQVPLSGGASESLDILRRLDAGGFGITDFQLRKPTLDDVFLTLTDLGAGR